MISTGFESDCRRDGFATRCLVPAFDRAIRSMEWQEMLWDRFFSALTCSPESRS